MALLNIANELDDVVSIKCHTATSAELCHSFLKKANEYNFRVLALNIRSFHCNFDKFVVTLQLLNADIDVIVLSECWLSDGQIIDEIPGYISFHSKSQKNKNGGVVMYAKKSQITSRLSLEIEDADTVLIEVDHSTIILGIYRSPSTRNFTPFFDSLDSTLHSLKQYSTIIITGDMNINICEDTDQQVATFLSLMASHGLLPAITKPTRGKSCLDHIFIKSPTVSFGLTCNSSITDHDIVIGCMSYTKQKKPHIIHKYKINEDAVATEINLADWSSVTSETSVNLAVKAFNNIVATSLHKHTKTVKLGRSWVKIKPWITTELLRCIRHRDKLHLDAKYHPGDPVRHLIYTRYRNFCNKQIKKTKNEYYNKQLTENKNDTKKLWKVIKNICYPSSKSFDSSDLLHIVKNSPYDSLQDCNRHFVSVGNKLAEEILNKNHTTQNALVSAYKSTACFLDSLFMVPTDYYELSRIISQSKSHSAPGPDKITMSLLKKCLPSISTPLLHIYNCSLATGVFPECWKTAAVTPIHKKGAQNHPDNYRPIALLNIVSKLLESIVNARLVSYLAKHQVISDKQFGFRKGRSTEDAVTLLVNTVSSHVETGQKCLAIFLDLAKAFDSVSVHLLLKKLETLGIRGVALKWFASYLIGRKQFVKVGSYTSSDLEIQYGVPQGSVLGPPLFTMYMNDIVNCTLVDADIISYADDTVIVFHGETWDQVHRTAEEGLTDIASLLDNNLLTLNAKKTKYIAFSKTSIGGPSNDFYLKLHSCSSVKSQDYNRCTCTRIERTTSLNYLGVTIDEHINYNEQIASLANRARKMIFLVKKLRDCTPPETMRQIYLALCQSVLQYCITVWGSACKTQMIKIEIAQRAILKVILKRPFRYSTDSIYGEFKVLRVRQLYILNATVKTHKVLLNREDFDSLTARRVFRMPTPKWYSSLARRSPKFSQPNTYNNVCRHCALLNCNAPKCKKLITNWLLTLSYEATENLLEHKSPYL